MDHQHGDEQRRARVSAIMDGQSDEPALHPWLSGDSRAAEERAAWHAYHLIGDVLRSPDLASTAERDQQLLHRVQQALEKEPVVLAPTAPRPLRVRRRLWAGVAAALSGVVVVGSAYLATRVDTGPVGPAVVSVSPSAEELRRASAGIAPFGSAADRQAAGDASWAAPGGAVALSGFKEILRLPRGPAQRPFESVQVLYSNGSATISVLSEPHQPGVHVMRTEASERLNTLTVQRDGTWLTLSGDVPLGTLQQMALALRLQP